MRNSLRKKQGKHVNLLLMLIRKISIGRDYKDAMHYVVGQQVLSGHYSIAEINQEENSYSIWVKKNGEIVKWKEIVDTPLIVEYNLNAV